MLRQIKRLEFPTQLDGNDGDPNLSDQSGNHLEQIGKHQSFRLRYVRSPAPVTPYFINIFKRFWGPDHWFLSKVLSLTILQRVILRGIAVLHVQIGPPSPKLERVIFVVFAWLGHSQS